MDHTKHTPGPWSKHQQDPWSPRWILGPAPGNDFIARMGHNAEKFLPNEIANWNLAVAAPDLLEACEDMHDLLERIHADLGPHRCTVDCPDIGKRTDRARAAIAKATGKNTNKKG